MFVLLQRNKRRLYCGVFVVCKEKIIIRRITIGHLELVITHTHSLSPSPLPPIRSRSGVRRGQDTGVRRGPRHSSCPARHAGRVGRSGAGQRRAPASPSSSDGGPVVWVNMYLLYFRCMLVSLILLIIPSISSRSGVRRGQGTYKSPCPTRW